MCVHAVENAEVNVEKCNAAFLNSLSPEPCCLAAMFLRHTHTHSNDCGLLATRVLENIIVTFK